MRLTPWVVDGFRGRPIRAKLRDVQRAVGADDSKTKAAEKRARRAAKRQNAAS